MKLKIFIILPIILFFLGGCTSQKVTREDTEWSDFWWGHESDTSKPRVLFIGNSISRGYYPTVSAKLSGVANCDRYATSRSIEDPALFSETRMAMANYHHAVIHFNNGLHGWHLTNEQYEKGLRKYVKFLESKKSKGCRLIYSLTTPYPSKEPGQKLDPVKNQVVIDRNRIARKIMEENNIPVIDLYGLMEPELEKYSGSKGNVHYNNEGYERLAEGISSEILKRIKK
jgi:hypothetical protein